MKITAIRADGFVSVDGEGFSGIDLSALDSISMLGATARVIQWYGSLGDIEFRDSQNRTVANFQIQDFTSFNWIIDAFNVRKAEHQALQAQIAAESAATLAAQQTAVP